MFTRSPVPPVSTPPPREGGSALELGCDQLRETVAELVCGGGTIMVVCSTPMSVTMSLSRFDDAVVLHPHHT